VDLDYGIFSTTLFRTWNLEKKTKVIAIADDLLIAVKAQSVREAGNITNLEMDLGYKQQSYL